jgi:pyruvate dehydrogenase E2 component (dihydrolipoamide acetyltransferase)
LKRKSEIIMAKILDMPKLSPTMEEGVLSTWHKKEGDAVEVDDLLAEVETDKATMEFRAFDKGTLLKILVEPGTLVKLGQAVAVLGNAGEDVSALVAGAGGAKQEAASQNSEEKTPEEKRPAEKQETKSNEAPPVSPTMHPPTQTTANIASKTTTPKRASSGSMLDRTERGREVSAAASTDANGDRVMASPYVRKVARDRGIDLHGAKGSGPGGRIVAEDLDVFASTERHPGDTSSPKVAVRANGDAAPTAMTLAKNLAEPESRPLSMMRKTIARRLVESKRNVPHFYLTIDVDAGKLAAFREEVNREFEPKANDKEQTEKPLRVSLNDLLIKAVATALVRVPECNAQFSDDAILIHRRVDISVAVAIADGLVTPVIRNADQKSVVAIAREVRDLAGRARNKKLKLEEMQDGTFSISNLGMFGIDSFAAVINPPEGAILAIGQTRDEPIVKHGENGPEIAIGKKLAMTLSCDHRVIDGAVGAAFLAELRTLIEHPMRVLTG